MAGQVKKSSKAKKPSAFDKPVNISADLAAVVGKGPMSRTKITKALWAYIKKHDLQNPDNRREILSDEKLKKILGNKKRVDMFEMTKLVSKHID